MVYEILRLIQAAAEGAQEIRDDSDKGLEKLIGVTGDMFKSPVDYWRAQGAGFQYGLSLIGYKN